MITNVMCIELHRKQRKKEIGQERTNNSEHKKVKMFTREFLKSI